MMRETDMAASVWNMKFRLVRLTGQVTSFTTIKVESVPDTPS